MPGGNCGERVPFLSVNSGPDRALRGNNHYWHRIFCWRTSVGAFPSVHIDYQQVHNPEEISELNSALQSGGQDTLLHTLSKMKAGRIEIGTGVGATANAIIASQEEGRTKLIVLYERNLRFAELRFGSKSEDYKFGYTELYLGQGNHEGMLIPAAKVRLREGNTWEVEDFGTFPARLMGLQVHGGGREAR